MVEKISFVIEDDSVLVKYNEIWNRIKKTDIKVHSKAVFEKYIRTKGKTFNGVVNTNFWSNEIPKETRHYTCISIICIDSVIKRNKKNYPQVRLFIRMQK